MQKLVLTVRTRLVGVYFGKTFEIVGRSPSDSFQLLAVNVLTVKERVKQNKQVVHVKVLNNSPPKMTKNS